jgi:hypothetical protein
VAGHARNGMTALSVRFGNVLGSAGSAIPVFQAQIQRGGPVTITHRDVTRYFMTIEEAAYLVVQAAVVGNKGEVLVLDMGDPVRIVELVENLVDELAPGPISNSSTPGCAPERSCTRPWSALMTGLPAARMRVSTHTPCPTSTPRRSMGLRGPHREAPRTASRSCWLLPRPRASRCDRPRLAEAAQLPIERLATHHQQVTVVGARSRVVAPSRGRPCWFATRESRDRICQSQGVAGGH